MNDTIEEKVSLTAGQQAPDFTLTAEDGSSVSLHDFRGKQVVIYFYPAAMTSGCTTQACDFRDNLERLNAMGYQVLGISHDSLEKLREFKAHDHLTFPLLSDEDLTVHYRYGAYGERNAYGTITQGVLRSTFVVNEEGTLIFARYNVKATGHVDMLIRELNKLHNK